MKILFARQPIGKIGILNHRVRVRWNGTYVASCRRFITQPTKKRLGCNVSSRAGGQRSPWHSFWHLTPEVRITMPTSKRERSSSCLTCVSRSCPQARTSRFGMGNSFRLVVLSMEACSHVGLAKQGVPRIRNMEHLGRTGVMMPTTEIDLGRSTPDNTPIRRVQAGRVRQQRWAAKSRFCDGVSGSPCANVSGSLLKRTPPIVMKVGGSRTNKPANGT